jgi:hypothetical protein
LRIISQPLIQFDIAWERGRIRHQKPPQCIAKMGNDAIYSPTIQTPSTTSLTPLTFAEVAAFFVAKSGFAGLTIAG